MTKIALTSDNNHHGVRLEYVIALYTKRWMDVMSAGFIIGPTRMSTEEEKVRRGPDIAFCEAAALCRDVHWAYYLFFFAASPSVPLLLFKEQLIMHSRVRER